MFFFWPKSFHVRVLLLLVWAVQPATVLRAGQTAIRPLQVADQTVEVVTYNFGDHPQWLLCNVHDDENTSVQAGLKALAARSGRLVELKHSGEREIVFQIGGTEYRCDPNRIFTPVGVKATLEKLSGYNEQAETEVTRLGQMLIEHYQVDQVTAVIALHNNTEGRYAATSYVKGQEYEKEASAIHLIPGVTRTISFSSRIEGCLTQFPRPVSMRCCKITPQRPTMGHCPFTVAKGELPM